MSCAFVPEYEDDGKDYPIGMVHVEINRHTNLEWDENGVTLYGEKIVFDNNHQSQSLYSLYSRKASGSSVSNLEKISKSSSLLKTWGHFSRFTSFFPFLNTNEASFIFLEAGIKNKGTGFLVKIGRMTYLITNFHVICCVENVENILFQMYDDNSSFLEFSIKKIIALSALGDIAVLELNFPPSFDRDMKLLSRDGHVLIGEEVQVRGFPEFAKNKREYLVQAYTLPRQNTSKDICMLIDDNNSDDSGDGSSNLERDFRGMSGSPVFLKNTNNIISIIWGIGVGGLYKRNKENNNLIRTLRYLVSTSSKKALDLIHSGIQCETTKECFIQGIETLRSEYFENNRQAWYRVRKMAGCHQPSEERPHYCDSNFFKSLNHRLEGYSNCENDLL